MLVDDSDKTMMFICTLAAKRPDSRTTLCDCSSKSVQRCTIQKTLKHKTSNTMHMIIQV